MSYRVFVRNWWRLERGASGWTTRVPNPGARKTTVCRVATEEEARARCREHRATHEPGRLSRKAEYEEIW